MPELVSFDGNKDKATYVFKGDVQGISQSINQFFSLQKYKLEKGTPEKGVYGTGSAILRVLFGAFVKRYEFGIDIAQHESNVKVEFSKKKFSGVMGGAIGYVKLNKEFERLTNELKNLK